VKGLTWFVVFAALLVGTCAAETLDLHPVNIYILRTAEQLQSPHILTYRVAEWEQMRGRWIAPDVGYYDTAYGKDQIWFAGAGAVIGKGPRIQWEQELYVTQEAGPESHDRRSLWVWPVMNLTLSSRFSAQIAAYPTIPLNKAQAWGYDVDRAKIERRAGSHWRAGVGYSGGTCSALTWQNSPFFTATRNTTAGSFEVWLQSTPGGGQVQLRYQLVHGNR
jgi:hypothetical protein